MIYCLIIINFFIISIYFASIYVNGGEKKQFKIAINCHPTREIFQFLLHIFLRLLINIVLAFSYTKDVLRGWKKLLINRISSSLNNVPVRHHKAQQKNDAIISQFSCELSEKDFFSFTSLNWLVPVCEFEINL